MVVVLPAPFSPLVCSGTVHPSAVADQERTAPRVWAQWH
jgi:hypothetical protein